MTDPEPAAGGPLDLKSDEGLRQACRRAEAAMDPERIWTLAAYLKRVHDTPADKRSSVEFHELIWLDKTVGPSRAGISLETTIPDADFRTRLADQIEPLIGDPDSRVEQRATALTTLFTSVRKRARQPQPATHPPQ